MTEVLRGFMDNSTSERSGVLHLPVAQSLPFGGSLLSLGPVSPAVLPHRDQGSGPYSYPRHLMSPLPKTLVP